MSKEARLTRPGRRAGGILNAPSTAPGGNDPGKRVKPNTVIMRVRGKQVIEALEHAYRRVMIESLQSIGHDGEAANPAKGGIDVLAIVDGLVDLGKLGMDEAAGVQ